MMQIKVFSSVILEMSHEIDQSIGFRLLASLLSPRDAGIQLKPVVVEVMTQQNLQG